MPDLSHYGDPPPKPRDESLALRVAIRLGAFVLAGIVAGVLFVALYGAG